MDKLESFKKGVTVCAKAEECRNRMSNLKQFSEVLENAEKLEDLAIDLKWQTMKWKDGTRQMVPVVDKIFEIIIKYNPETGFFEVVKNLGDPSVASFTMEADLLINELINPATLYSVAGVWDASTDFSKEAPW